MELTSQLLQALFMNFIVCVIIAQWNGITAHVSVTVTTLYEFYCVCNYCAVEMELLLTCQWL